MEDQTFFSLDEIQQVHGKLKVIDKFTKSGFIRIVETIKGMVFITSTQSFSHKAQSYVYRAQN